MVQFEDLVKFEGIEDVPRNQRMQFVSNQRRETATQIRDCITQLQETFPKEFNSIKPIEQTEDIEEAFEDFKSEFENIQVQFPIGVFEFLWVTYGTEPDINSEFGLPSFPLTKSGVDGYTQIDLDFDEEIDPLSEKFQFLVCVDIKSKSFGSVKLWNQKKLIRVSDSFEEFFKLFTEMMVEEFANAGDERKIAIEDFYYQFE
ncbi:hypothetical protein BC833DRAFT_597429 [Globomyces pollinis-pini]|nr:hypothetical protein BC833DRAFT_597429 [Globomyces pollinis-pini]KAJ2996004.1 hypothetical protein HDV02_000233 [Globomyces sp. JEL0801]